MAKADMLCPFTNGSCKECALYRGRHYYLSFCRQYRDYLSESEENRKLDTIHNSVSFEIIGNWLPPWISSGNQTESVPKIKLKVVDMDTGETKVCSLEEAKTWDWSNPEMMRVIGDIQATSWDKLVELISFKAKKGYQEVVVYEAPRFMLLGGG